MRLKGVTLTTSIRALRSRAAVNGYVGAQHKFHDADFARGWSDRFVPSPPRVALFDLILEQAAMPSIANAHVVELGLGPGYLARHLLDRQPDITYEGVDFSDAFFEIAKKTIGKHLPRVTLTKADLVDPGWPKTLSRQPRAIISTWTLHDLGSQQAVEAVYARCYETLPQGGVLVNGDFIKPEGTSWIYEPGRFEIARHLELLRKVGFSEARSLAHLEPNIENPTAAQNYACLTAVR
jgi:SAM-dependent methyltransferase